MVLLAIGTVGKVVISAAAIGVAGTVGFCIGKHVEKKK